MVVIVVLAEAGVVPGIVVVVVLVMVVVVVVVLGIVVVLIVPFSSGIGRVCSNDATAIASIFSSLVWAVLARIADGM